MSEQKKQFSTLCLTGFIFSILPILFLIISTFNDSMPRNIRVKYTEVVLPTALIALPLIGLILSIVGLVTARKKGMEGKGFAVAGIVLPTVAAVIAALVFGVFFLESIGTSNRVKQNEMYSMGAIGAVLNTEYDISPYMIPEGYDPAPSNVSEAELKSFAESKLQTISSENPKSIKGVYQDYDFLIVRSDIFDDWSAVNCPGGIQYSNGYAIVYHEEMWEVGGTRPAELAVYRDPSDKFIVITNCRDHKVITEFFT